MGYNVIMVKIKFSWALGGYIILYSGVDNYVCAHIHKVTTLYIVLIKTSKKTLTILM